MSCPRFHYMLVLHFMVDISLVTAFRKWINRISKCFVFVVCVYLRAAAAALSAARTLHKKSKSNKMYIYIDMVYWRSACCIVFIVHIKKWNEHETIRFRRFSQYSLRILFPSSSSSFFLLFLIRLFSSCACSWFPLPTLIPISFFSFNSRFRRKRLSWAVAFVVSVDVCDFHSLWMFHFFFLVAFPLSVRFHITQLICDSAQWTHFSHDILPIRYSTTNR